MGWRRISTYGVSLLEQAVASMGMMAVQALAARWLGVAGYGRLALALIGVFSGLAIMTALVLDPLSARGRPAGRHGAALWWLAAGIGVSALILHLLTADLEDRRLEVTATAPLWLLLSDVGLGVMAAPSIGLWWLLRRWAHATGRPRRALLASTGWTVLTLGGMGLLHLLGVLSVAGVLLCALMAGILVSLPLAWAGRLSGLYLRGVLRWHWRMGSWLLAAAPFWMVATQVPLLAMAHFQGATGAGLLRAMILFGMPVMQGIAALGSVHQPRVSMLYRAGHQRRAAEQAGMMTLLAVAGALGWGVVLMLAGTDLVVGLLGDGFAPVADMAPLAVLPGLIAACACGLGVFTRAGQRMRLTFGATVASAILATMGAMLLIPDLGVVGALLALALAQIANLLVLTVGVALLRRPLSRPLAVSP